MRGQNRDQTFILRTVEVGLAAARSRSGSNDHSRRILSRALGIPKSRIRVEKPRIGGGFGAKQTAVCEMYPAFVTMKTGRPAKINYTREEAQIAGSPRHEMEIRVRLGASSDGTIRALDLYTLSNTGAYRGYGATQGIFALESAVNDLYYGQSRRKGVRRAEKEHLLHCG